MNGKCVDKLIGKYCKIITKEPREERVNVVTGNAGVDVVSFGGTKNGMMFGDAVVFLVKNYLKTLILLENKGCILLQRCVLFQCNLKRCYQIIYG